MMISGLQSKYFYKNYLQTQKSCNRKSDVNTGQKSFEFPKNISFINFKGCNLSKQHSPQDFFKKYDKAYKDIPLLSTIRDIIKKPNCYINNGSKNITFSIPKVDDYIIRMPINIYKKITDMCLDELKPIRDYYETLNIGQPILENSFKIQICKRQKGEPVSTLDWFKYKFNPEILTRDSALDFLENIEALSKFPISSYQEIIETLQKIDKHEIDYLNTGNFLIDKENKKINRVDVTDIKTDSPTPISKKNLTYPLINVFLHSHFRDLLTEEEKNRLDSATNLIIDKINIICREKNIPEGNEYPDAFWKIYIIQFIGNELYKELQNDILRSLNNLNIH